MRGIDANKKNIRAAPPEKKNGHTGAVMDKKNYRPSDKEPFMNERQREYFRQKLLAWKEDILKEAKETLAHLRPRTRTIPTSPTAHRRKPTARSNCARAIASAS